MMELPTGGVRRSPGGKRPSYCWTQTSSHRTKHAAQAKARALRKHSSYARVVKVR